MVGALSNEHVVERVGKRGRRPSGWGGVWHAIGAGGYPIYNIILVLFSVILIHLYTDLFNIVSFILRGLVGSVDFPF